MCNLAAHRHLMEADVDKCAARRAAVARVGALEADVAGACGLAMVYCTPGLRTTPEYAAFLTRLAGGAHRRGYLCMQAERLSVMHCQAGAGRLHEVQGCLMRTDRDSQLARHGQVLCRC